MKKEFRPRRRVAGRNVHQMEAVTETLELQTYGPIGLIVLISTDDKNFRPEILNRPERRVLTHIAEMPDLIRFPDSLEQTYRQPIVGVRDNSDAQRAGHLANRGDGENRTDFSRMAPG